MLGKRIKKYDLYLGAKNQEEFIKHLRNVIKDKKPEVNIEEIASQFFHRELINGQPVESGKLIFRKTLNAEKRKLMSLKRDNQPTSLFGAAAP